jgi:hypothetical protein
MIATISPISFLRSCLLLLAVVLLSTPTAASGSARKNPLSGLRLQLGIALSDLDLQSSSRGASDTNIGPAGGIAYSNFRTRTSSIETGVILETRGGTWVDRWTSQGTSLHYEGERGFLRSLRLTYLSIPLGIGIAPQIGSANPYFRAGVQVGYLLRSRGDSKDRVTGEYHERDVDLGGVRYHLEGFFTVGVGLALGNRHLTFGITYLPGLSNPDGSVKIEGSLPRMRNRTIRLTLGMDL